MNSVTPYKESCDFYCTQKHNFVGEELLFYCLILNGIY